MIVTAALAWWDEKPEDLAECVRGVARIADRIVALDGAYRRYPDATIVSPPEQAQIIHDTAQECGIESRVLEPSELWAGQVAKRSFLMARAAEGTDWIAIVDSDHVIQTDRAAARAELESMTDVDMVAVSMGSPGLQRGQNYATNWHRDWAGRTSSVLHLFRALPDLRCEERHWTYSALKDGERVSMNYGEVGYRGKYPSAPWKTMQTPYLVEHRYLERDERHILANRAFCNDREIVVRLTGQEDDVPGLPAPVWDFTTVPY